MKSRKIATLAVAVAGVFLLPTLAACSTDTGGASEVADEQCTPKWEFDTLNEGKLASVAPDYPPFVYLEGDDMRGFEGEFLARFAEDSCLELDHTEMPGAGVIEMITNSRADVASGGWWPNPDRLEVVGMSTPMISNPHVFVTEGKPSADLDDYEGKKVGTVQAWALSADVKKWGGDDVTLYESYQAAIADLAAGRLDAVILSVASASWSLTEDQYKDFEFVVAEEHPAIKYFNTPSASSVPYVKDNAALGEALNAALVEYYEEGWLEELAVKNGFPAELVEAQG